MLQTVFTALFALTAAQAGQGVYRVDSDASRLVVEVGRAGLLKIFGHDHRIAARRLTGQATFEPGTLQSSHFVLEIDAATFVVADEELSDEDRARVQSDMETQALALADHPTIRFESESVSARRDGDGTYRLEVKGKLSLRGVERALTVPLRVDLGEGELTATGELELHADRWGVPQISAVGGSVKTKKELGIAFAIVARR